MSDIYKTTDVQEVAGGGVIYRLPVGDSETVDQIPPQVRETLDILVDACGRNLVAVVFFGSVLLGTSPSVDSAADLFVVVENYLRFYKQIGARLPSSRHAGIMASLNRTLPPNIISIGDPGDLRAGAKCFVITEGDLGNELSPTAKDHFCRGRLSQRVHVVYARGPRDRTKLELRLETARRLSLDWVLLYLAAPFTVLDYCLGMMEVSYSGEIRPEAKSRVREVFAAQQTFFRLAYGRILDDAVRDGVLERVGDGYRSALVPTWRERQHWRWFFQRSKLRATLRWFKYMLTFDDWLDYIVRKVERRTGVRVELTKAERRAPVLLLWPKLWRVFKAMRSRTRAQNIGDNLQ